MHISFMSIIKNKGDGKKLKVFFSCHFIVVEVCFLSTEVLIAY
jgi:hypothetical protein